METCIIQKGINAIQNSNISKADVIDYYSEATADYIFWSKKFNMHFGYFTGNPFNREEMLEEMNKQILSRLNIKANQHIVDVGCGLGATMRTGTQLYPNTSFTGLTITPWQQKHGTNFNKAKKLDKNITLNIDDYNNITSLQASSADGAYAVESICHSFDKKKTIQQLHKILKPGKQFVIADGFLKRDESELSKTFKYCYKQLCEGWQLPNLANINEFKKDLETTGFKNIKVEDISFRIAPSVLHAPPTVIKYLLYALTGKVPMKKQNINNLKGSIISLFAGLHFNEFRYYIISGTKN